MKPKSMKTSGIMLWGSKIFTQEFLEWHGNEQYKVFNNKYPPKHHQNQRKVLIQIWYKTTSILNPSPWKLVIQEHKNASLSYMYLWYLELWSIWIWYYRDIHNIPNLGHQISSLKCKHHSNKCVINMRVWGNGEEWMRE